MKVSGKSRSVLVALVTAVALVVPALALGAEGLTGPVFKLDTAPNGDIVAASVDGGIGIIDRRTGDLVDSVDVPMFTYVVDGEERKTNINGVAAIGTRSFWVVTASPGPPLTAEDKGQALWRISNGKARMVVNLWEVENDLNPDGGLIDSNPYDVYALGGDAALVVDAGGNSLLRVDNQGGVEVIATFPVEFESTDHVKDLAGCATVPSFFCSLPPAIPTESVPTSVVVGPDGDYYVGELKGFPAPTGQSSVWRIDGDATNVECGVDDECTKAIEGFTSIVDLALGPDGLLYVSELDEASWAAVEIFGTPEGGTLNACDPVTGVCGEPIAEGVNEHTAVTFGKDGRPWVTIDAVHGGAQIVPLG